MSKKLSRFMYFIVSFAFLVYVNLYFSDMIVANLMRGMKYSNNLFSLNYVKNTGAAFSLMQNSTEVLIILSVIALVLLFIYVINHLKVLSMKSLFFVSLLSAGIAGNLHERIAYGYVRDFVSLNFIDFPVFNIADVFINIGVIVLVILILSKKTK